MTVHSTLAAVVARCAPTPPRVRRLLFLTAAAIMATVAWHVATVASPAPAVQTAVVALHAALAAWLGWLACTGGGEA